MASAGAPADPPGWYRDPSGVARLRYWDGSGWTDGVSDGREVGHAPLPPPEEAPALRDDRAPWPAAAVGVALAGALAGVVLATVGAAVGEAVAGGRTRALTIALAQSGLALGLLGACAVASRRYGTGRLRTDLGLRIRGVDWAAGFGLSWLARLAGVVILLPIIALDRRYAGSNLEGIQALDADPAALVALVAVGLLVAPVVEELFFRGLLQRALEPLVRPVGAVLLQAALFGLAHLSVDLGAANVSVVVATGVAGVVFGAAARRTRRLGASVTGHGFYNAFGFLFALLVGAG